MPEQHIDGVNKAQTLSADQSIDAGTASSWPIAADDRHDQNI